MQYVLITGCSASSIGSAIALEFAKRPDWHVYATARDLTKLSHLDSFANVTQLKLDVTSKTSISEAVAKISASANGALDILVNNAGIQGDNGPVLDADIDDYRKVFETNVFAPLVLSQAFAPMLVASKGQIINVGSTSAVSIFVWQAAYAASKAAITSLSRTLEYELAPLGVTVTTLVVGGVSTNIIRNVQNVRVNNSGYYSGIESEIKKFRSHGELEKHLGPIEPVAESIVQNALRSKPKTELWTGTLVWIIWILTILRLTWVLETVANNAAGLKKLKSQRATLEKLGKKEK